MSSKSIENTEQVRELERAILGGLMLETERYDAVSEIIEIPNHPWFVGVQFHPEYSSNVLNPHPLFNSFIEACIINKK